MPRARSHSRKQEILQALAAELETNPGARITTARLAEVLGVSEAALYRHFPSKAKMFEGLLDFAEESVSSRVNRILAQSLPADERVGQVAHLLLTFAERNPGITRVLLGEALMGENKRLRSRATQFFERTEAQLRQALRDAALDDGERTSVPASIASSLVLAVIEGRMTQFSRSAFRRSPTEDWPHQWRVLRAALFPPAP